MSEGAAVMAHVARLHYVRGLAKQDIARRLGISRFKVARLLDEARERGVVRFEIEEPVEVDEDRGRALEAAFGLDLAVVVGDAGLLPRAAVAWLPDLVRQAGTLGVAWGTTLQAIADELPAAEAGSPAAVVQICGAIPGLDQGTGPAELALRFAERLGARLYPLPAPALAGVAARDELLANDAVRPTVEMFDAVGVALVGIGPATRLPGAPEDAAGHILTHLYDAEGRPVESDLAARAIAMSSEQMRACRVVAVAGGPGKATAILGALRTGIVDTLFTDSANAAHALEARA